MLSGAAAYLILIVLLVEVWKQLWCCELDVFLITCQRGVQGLLHTLHHGWPLVVLERERERERDV